MVNYENLGEYIKFTTAFQQMPEYFIDSGKIIDIDSWEEEKEAYIVIGPKTEMVSLSSCTKGVDFYMETVTVPIGLFYYLQHAGSIKFTRKVCCIVNDTFEIIELSERYRCDNFATSCEFDCDGNFVTWKFNFNECKLLSTNITYKDKYESYVDS